MSGPNELDGYQITVRFKERDRNPGDYKVLSINWEQKWMTVTNGAVRLYPCFEEVEVPSFKEDDTLDNAITAVLDEGVISMEAAKMMAERLRAFLKRGRENPFCPIGHAIEHWTESCGSTDGQNNGHPSRSQICQ